MTEREDLTGEVIGGRYRLTGLIADGGMGRVYRAEHLRLRSHVAVKILAHDHSIPRAAERFLREAQAAARIGHENIVQVFDCGETSSGALFIAMEYLQGEDLEETLARERSLPPCRVRRIMIQIASALQAAHDAGVIHRDLKPANCLRTTRGENPDFIKVLDFGIAKLRGRGEERLTGTRGLLGTPEYMSPEQARGKAIDHRADVYAAGIIAYELLTGDVPFTGDSFMGVLLQHLNDAVAPPSALRPRLPQEIDALVLRALAKDPEQRFQSMAELEAAWDALDVEEDSTPTIGSPALDLLPDASTPLGQLSPGHAPLETSAAVTAAYDAASQPRRAGIVALAVLIAIVIVAIGAYRMMTHHSLDEDPRVALGTGAPLGAAASTHDPDPVPAAESGETTGTPEGGEMSGEPASIAEGPVEPVTKTPVDRVLRARRRAIRAALEEIAPVVSAACRGTVIGGERGASVTVRVRVSEDGRILSSAPAGEHARSVVGRCVADAAAKARVSSGGRDVLTLRHTFTL